MHNTVIKKFIRESATQVLRKTIDLLTHPNTIHFLWEDPKVSAGTIILIVDNEAKFGYYSHNLQFEVENLRTLYPNSYNVVYFVSDAITKNEETWLKNRIKRRQQTSL